MNASKSTKNGFLVFYLLLSLLHLVFEWQQYRWGIIGTKPLLLTVLLVDYLRSCGFQRAFDRLMVVALFFSILGDTFLLFTEQSAGGVSFFLLGLGSFLVTHLAYAFAFGLVRSCRTGYLSQAPWWGVPYLLFFALFLYWIWPGLPTELRFPVVLYSMAIIGMQLMALNIGFARGEGWFLLMIGAIAFLFSDSLIAVHRFLSDSVEIPMIRIWIMSLYLGGQFLLVVGAKKVRPGRNTKF